MEIKYFLFLLHPAIAVPLRKLWLVYRIVFLLFTKYCVYSTKRKKQATKSPDGTQETAKVFLI